MADALLASMVVNTLINKRKEKFSDEDGDFFYTDQPTASPSPFFGASLNRGKPGSWDWFSFAVSTVISIMAIYLSWSCNTAMGYGTTEKVLYAAGAGLFGVLYLFYYVLFRGDACRAVLKS